MEPTHPFYSSNKFSSFLMKAPSKIASLFQQEERDPRCFMGDFISDLYKIILRQCSVRTLGRLERVNKHTARIVGVVFTEKAVDWGWRKSYHLSHKHYIGHLFLELNIFNCRGVTEKIPGDYKLDHYFRYLPPSHLYEFLNHPDTYHNHPGSWGLLNFIKKIGLLKANNPFFNRNSINPAAVIRAIECGQKSVIRYFIRHGLNPDALTRDGNRPLHHAVDYKHLSIIRMLLKANADVRLENHKQLTPLQIACGAGNGWSSHANIPIVTVLLDSGANPSQFTSGLFPIHLAALRGNLTVVDLLLQRGANINQLDHVGRTPLAIACGAMRKNEFQINPHLVKYLLRHGADDLIADNQGNIPLNHAVQIKSRKILILLLEKQMAAVIKQRCAEIAETLTK